MLDINLTPHTQVELTGLTHATLEGNGVFDVLMRANKAHLDQEFKNNRIKGPEYATVYLGALNAVMGTALQFLLQKDKINREALMLAAQLDLLKQQGLNAVIEGQALTLNLAKIAADTALTLKQIEKLATENALTATQKLQIEAQTQMVLQQKINLTDELLTANLQRLKLVQDTATVTAQTLQVTGQTLLVTQQRANLLDELTTAGKQRAKLDTEIILLVQKNVTEQAQTNGAVLNATSVLGKQSALYVAQAEGFSRDAEQKAAKVMVDSWNVRRTTDEGTVADATNKLNDANIGAVVAKLISGIGA